MPEKLDCVVVGAGVVGLAIARLLAVSGREVLVLEAEEAFGTQTSSRNSEVIHAGIYYPQSSQKAALCLSGKRQLYAYCQDRAIDHKQCGKLIVATDKAQTVELEHILAAGQANGVDDLIWLPQSEVAQKAPELRAHAAIWSPSTGIVDSHQLMLAFIGDIENAGGTVAYRSRVKAVNASKNPLLLDIESDGQLTLSANVVINCAGIGATSLACNVSGLDRQTIPAVDFAKGSYFSYGGPSPFDCLVYPVPTPGGLGIHLTLDQSGQARFGPDVEWINGIDYAVDPAGKEKFVNAIKDYWPSVNPDKLYPAYSGIRVKTKPNTADFHDFIFSGPAQHGIAGLVNLYGIESPGLTSCLAIADHVAALIKA